MDYNELAYSSLKVVKDNAKSLKARRGKHYKNWKRGVLRYINKKWFVAETADLEN